jgi:hypothetical protein
MDFTALLVVGQLRKKRKKTENYWQVYAQSMQVIKYLRSFAAIVLLICNILKVQSILLQLR